MDEGLPPSVDATPEELNAAARALRELGVDPVPRDVAIRLSRRLDDELGPPPAVSHAKRRAWWRPVMVLAPVSAAALIAVAVVLSTSGGGTSQPTAASEAPGKPVPTQGVASGGTGASPTTDVVPLPKQALDSDLQGVASAARGMSEVADAAKAAALRARANVCKAKPAKKGCPKPRASTTTTP